jgi:DNA-binding response OmpR family regulator
MQQASPTSPKTVLLIEDDLLASELVSQLMSEAGFEVDTETDGIAGLSRGVCGTYDLIILDHEVPSLSGLEVCRKLREQARVTAPILMLTGQDSVEARVEGLQTGADDYLTKPFHGRELIARARSLIRRSCTGWDRQVLAVGDLVYDLASMTISREGRPLALTEKPRAVLQAMMEAWPRSLARKEITAKVWGHDAAQGNGGSLRQQLHLLRQVVDAPFSYPMIRRATAGHVGLFTTEQE